MLTRYLDYMPLYFQAVAGASALMSGVLILPIAITQSCSGIVCGFIIRKTGTDLDPTYGSLLIFRAIS